MPRTMITQISTLIQKIQDKDFNDYQYFLNIGCNLAAQIMQQGKNVYKNICHSMSLLLTFPFEIMQLETKVR